MSERLLKAALVAVLALAASGCGSGSSSSTAAAPTSSSSTASASAPNTTTTTSTRRSATSSSTSTAAMTTTSVSASGSVTTAPPPTPASTPSAPAGLTQTTGYGTYELCSSGCSGGVPASLRRPLKLPQTGSGGSCPVSPGSGPVKPLNAAQLSLQSFIGSSWQAARVTWASAPSYTGPVLIRGRQLGGAGAVGFGEGHVPYDELQLLAPGSQAPPAPGGGRAWLSYTRVRSAGCYAYQVDGTSFSTVIVFRATG
jgi:hypothetical protein